MSLSPCRECGQQVSSEAAVCPHCGVAHPATVEAPAAAVAPGGKSTAFWFWLVAGAVVTALAVAFGGYHLWQSQQGVKADGASLEAQIVDTYRNVGNLTLTATCPSTVRLHKGKIIDCSVERADNGASSPVFVTPTDDSGHFQMQLGEPSVLIP